MLTAIVGPFTIHLFESAESADPWPIGQPGVIFRGVRGWWVVERPLDVLDATTGTDWAQAIHRRRLPGIARDDVAGALAAGIEVVRGWLAEGKITDPVDRQKGH